MTGLNTIGRRLLPHLLLLLGALAMIYPLVWMISSSVKPANQIFGDTSLWPTEFQFSNYREGWNGVGISFGVYFANSAFVCVVSILGNLLSSSMAAFAFARLQFRSKRFLFALMLATIMLPVHVLLVPQYVLFSNLGWTNTFLPLVLPKFFAVDAFFVFLMVQFIRGLPRELDQAAMVDGCSPFRIYWYIILPLMRPALVTTAIFTFIWTWNDFLTPLLYLNNPFNFTVALGLRQFLDSTAGSAYGAMFAMTTLSLIPVIVVFLLFQRLLVEGIATHGLKG